MKVLVCRSAGFCWGVDRAVRRARELARAGRPVFTDGPLIHNRPMMDQLRAEGVRECADLAALRDEVLMVRAHGIPPARRAELEKLPVQLVDATCPDVARIQKLIRQHAERGFSIVIFGDAGHAEVTGLLGHALGRGQVVARPEDVPGLTLQEPVCLVSQSTQFVEDYARVAAEMRRRCPQAVVLDTICRSTKKRQQELAEVAQAVDAIVVVGDAHSANTLRLIEIARRLRPTFAIETAAQIDPSAFREFRSVGLTAGASTPQFVLEEVQRQLESV